MLYSANFSLELLMLRDGLVKLLSGMSSCAELKCIIIIMFARAGRLPRRVILLS
jgi:hypothetical protein